MSNRSKQARAASIRTGGGFWIQLGIDPTE